MVPARTGCRGSRNQIALRRPPIRGEAAGLAANATEMKLSLAIQFGIWIIGGLAALLVAISLASRTICVAPSLDSHNHNQGAHQANYRPNALTDLIDEPTSRRIALAEPKHQDTENHSEQPDKSISAFARRVICDARSTDIGIMFFTYCLVIVGWFGIRSDERSTEAVERAYLFLGYSPPIFRSGRVNFDLAVTNSGRCIGVMKEIGYAFLQRDNLPASRREIDWPWETIEYDWATPAGVRRDKLKRLQGPIGDCLFVSYIEYQDVFTKRRQRSWMSMSIRPDAQEHERITRAGGDTWNEWD